MDPVGRASLVAVLDFEGVAADEFNDWYDLEHIPERLSCPGFMSAERWIGGPACRTSLLVYHLGDLSALDSPEYRDISAESFSPWSRRIIGMCRKFDRYEGEQLESGAITGGEEGASALLFVAMNVDGAIEDDFNDWYREEHVPLLKGVPGVGSVRRYRARAGPHKYFSIYHLDEPQVIETSAWRRASQTAWADRVRPGTRDHVRLLCHPYTGRKK